MSLPSRPLCRMAHCRLGAQQPASRRSRGASRRKPVLAASAFDGGGVASKARFRMGFRSFVGVPVFRFGCRSRQAASGLAPVRWSWLSSARGTSSTRRSRGERNGGDARAVDSFDGSAQGSRKTPCRRRYSGSWTPAPFTRRRPKRSRPAALGVTPAVEARRATRVTECQRYRARNGRAADNAAHRGE